MNHKTELDFLKQYLDFYLKKGQAMKDFKMTVIKSFVDTGQISIDALEIFMKEIEINEEIASKNERIASLERQIEILKDEVKKLKTTKPTVIVERISQIADPCSSGTFYTRSSC